ncbi:MAG: glycosyltransferase family 2 protein [Pseudomonadota bacterium]
MMNHIANADLSIIIVNWNTADLLSKCLKTVFANLGDLNAEIILVDNGSTDRSVRMVRDDYPSVEIIENQENVGFAAANNQAMRVCRGRHILLLNSDTEILDAVLTAGVERLDADATIGALGCQVLNTDGSRQISHRPFPDLRYLTAQLVGLHKLKGNPSPEQICISAPFKDVETLSGCFLMIRRAAIEQVGLLDESYFFFGEETEWCWRLGQAGWRVCYAPIGQITHHGGGSSGPLKYHRGVMLTEAIIRLHRQCLGLGSARIAWLLLLLINITRALYWAGPGRLIKPDIAAEKARYFRQLCRAMPSVREATSMTGQRPTATAQLKDQEAA